jgi:hypothetical protein
MGDELDVGRLHSALLDAARKAFGTIQREHPDEKFYAFALYTHDDVGYILPTSNSEEGLERATLRYVRENKSDFASHKASLRWSPCDWEYHLTGEDYFSEVERILDEGPDIYKIKDEERIERHVETVYSQCREVLKELDAEGLFGRREERKRVVINLLKGDQSEAEMLQWAKELNPEPAYMWFRTSLREGNDAFLVLLRNKAAFP